SVTHRTLNFSAQYDSSPTDLPCLPTRRSSDLAMGVRDEGELLCLPRIEPQIVRRKINSVIVTDFDHVGNLRARVYRERWIGFFEDRKSTRLNSSHQIISYAVFCLKKKNTSHNG